MENTTSRLHRILGINLEDYKIHNIDLFTAASKHEAKFTPYPKEIKERVLPKHGLKENSGTAIVDQLYTIINNARNRSFSYINCSKGKVNDPMNAYYFDTLTRENDIHPLDEASGIIRDSVRTYQADTERLRKISGSDAINSMLNSGGTLVSDSKHSIEEVYSLIESIYQNDLASSVSNQDKDPADKFVENMSRQKFFKDPASTRLDFLCCVEHVIGKRDRYMIIGMPDEVDDIAAQILGNPLPSEMIESKLMNKYYQLKSKLNKVSKAGSGLSGQRKEEVLSDINFIEDFRKDLSERIREVKNKNSLNEMIK